MPVAVSQDASDFLDLLGVGSESEDANEEEEEALGIFDLLEVDNEQRVSLGGRRSEETADEITVSTAYTLPIASLFDEGIDGDANKDGIFDLLATATFFPEKATKEYEGGSDEYDPFEFVSGRSARPRGLRQG